MFDLYVPQTGWAHRVDPRVKLLFVLISVMIVTLFSNLFFMATALVVIHLLMASAGVSRDRFVWVWRAMGPINLLIPVLWTVFYPEGEALCRLWTVEITSLALARGMMVAARLDTVAFVCALWLSTTEQTAIVRSLVKLGMPFEWGLMLTIGLRYIPTFYATYTVIAEAQQARALDLTQGNLFHRLRAQVPILTAMVISALRTANQLAITLESRALGVPGATRTYRRDIRCTRRDYVLTGALLLLLGGAITLRLMGIFVHPLRWT
jgi:energy-coupling factor transport system permease protein